MKTEAEEDREASYFAMCLLMPENLLRPELEANPIDLADDRAIIKLAKKFQVPTTLMAIRIGQLSRP